MPAAVPGASFPIVVLAAGGSRRLKQPKQLIPYKGGTLLRHAVQVALEAAVGPVLVVLGAEAGQCAAELYGLKAERVVHPGWGEGLGSTIRVGVRAARTGHPDLAGLVLMTCDQPGVPAATLRGLVEAVRGGARAAASFYSGTLGIPAAFARSELDALEALIGELGAKALLTGPGVTSVPCPEAALDVDTAEDLKGLEAGG